MKTPPGPNHVAHYGNFLGPVKISSNGTYMRSPGATTQLFIQGGDAGEARIDVVACNSDSVVAFCRLNNTFANPTKLAAGDQIVGIVGLGTDTDGTTTMQQGAAIAAYTLNAWSPSDHSFYWDIYTIPSGSTAFNTASRFHASGGLSVNSTTDPGAGMIASPAGFKFPSYTVAGLPAGVAGQTVWCSNARAVNTTTGVQEGPGLGTGSLVSYNGTAWKLVGSNVTAIA